MAVWWAVFRRAMGGHETSLALDFEKCFESVPEEGTNGFGRTPLVHE